MDWPWPGEDREGRAKRVALAYRELAVRLATVIGTDDAKTALLDLDRRWLELGQPWVVPESTDPYDAEDWICANDAAHYLGYRPTTIRKWAELKRKGGDGIIEQPGHDGKPRYNVGDIKRFLARRRKGDTPSGGV